MKKQKKIKEYEATLIGKDGFSKVMKIKEPCPMLFMSEQIESVYSETPCLYSGPPKIKRTFILDKEKSWKDKLVYKEIQPQKTNKTIKKENPIKIETILPCGCVLESRLMVGGQRMLMERYCDFHNIKN